MSVQPMGGDALLEIAFDEVGTKRLMRNSAMAYLEKKAAERHWGSMVRLFPNMHRTKKRLYISFFTGN